jgi:CDP-glucose 4,6-dehydratase
MSPPPTVFEPLRGRRVLLTGHTGFKGSWLALWLRELGADVAGMALDPPTQPNLFTEARLAADLRDIRQDLRDFPGVLEVFAEIQPELVMHLAAQPLVRLSYAQTLETYQTNFMGSVHVFEAAARTPSVRALVHVSTDKCYRNVERREGYSEEDPLGGHDPYSASKAAAEVAFLSYLDSRFAPEGRILAGSSRAGDVIGGGDWAEDRIVPDCARAISGGVPVTVRNPDSTRPWQHVLEALSGYLTLAAGLLEGRRDRAGGWNFGPGDENVRTVRELVDQIRRAWGSGSWTTAPASDRLHEATLLSLATGKARNGLGWEPRWKFEETVEHVVRWYKDFYAGGHAGDLCRRDIREYMAAG